MVRVLGTLLLTLSKKMGIFFIFEVKMGKPLAKWPIKYSISQGKSPLVGNFPYKPPNLASPLKIKLRWENTEISLRLIYRVYAKQLSLYSICEGPIKFNFNYYYLSKSLGNANLQTVGNVNLWFSGLLLWNTRGKPLAAENQGGRVKGWVTAVARRWKNTKIP